MSDDEKRIQELEEQVQKMSTLLLVQQQLLEKSAAYEKCLFENCYPQLLRVMSDKIVVKGPGPDHKLAFKVEGGQLTKWESKRPHRVTNSIPCVLFKQGHDQTTRFRFGDFQLSLYRPCPGSGRFLLRWHDDFQFFYRDICNVPAMLVPRLQKELMDLLGPYLREPGQ